MNQNIFDTYDGILLTSNWRWIPEKAGGWDLRGDPTRQKVIDKTNDPFILLVYQNKNTAWFSEVDLADRLLGFLIVSHDAINREECNSPDLTYEYKKTYRSSLKALRAFEFLPDSRIRMSELAPELRQREQLVHDLAIGIELTPSQLEIVKGLAYREVDLYGSTENNKNENFLPTLGLSSNSINTGEMGSPLKHIMATPHPNVWMTTFYGWNPGEWGCVGFTAEHQAATFKKETDPGVLLIVYGAKSKRTAKNLRGKVLGIYQLSHFYSESNKFLSPASIRKNIEAGEADKWKYAFKCERAWQIVSDQRPTVEEFAPETYSLGGHQHLGSQGRRVTRDEAVRLLDYDWEEVSVYGSDTIETSFPMPLSPSRAGPIGKKPSRSNSEPDGLREIYILKLEGSIKDFLGMDKKSLDGRWVIKAGLSKSPQSRCDYFNKALPQCAYSWSIFKTTLSDNDPHIVDGETAKIVERHFQLELLKADTAESLGGEFFLAHPEDIQNAWHFSRMKAKKLRKL